MTNTESVSRSTTTAHESPTLFDEITFRGVSVPNRVWLSPMCMYACERDGIVGDFHLAHYGAVAMGGAGLLITEATAVSPEGRVTPGDAGLWDDSQVQPWERVVDFIHASGSKAVVQLAHAGRKGGKYRNLPGDSETGGTIPETSGGWELLGASGEAFGRYSTPRAAEESDLYALIENFTAATRRAVEAGFDGVELHAAHGYLLHEFLSPVTNTRTDAWGGTAANRERLLFAIVDSIRSTVPEQTLLFVRLSASDAVAGGTEYEQTADLAVRLAARGVDLIDSSSGGLMAKADYDPYPGYQVPGASAVKRVGVRAGAVGLINDPHLAQKIIEEDQADVVLLGRELLRDPHWPRRAALVLEQSAKTPPPSRYHRAWLGTHARPWGA